MRILLDHGANVHGLPHGEELDEEGRLPRGDSPLHYSAINGSLPCVEMLIALHADVNRRSSRYGETPLHKAVLFGRTDVALQLITAGAAMDHKNDRGISAVKLCELCGGSEMLEVFAKDFPALELVTPDYIRREFADHGAQPSDESIVKGERLLWDLVVALYLYKRPRHARALLVESLLAAYQTCLPGFSPTVLLREIVRSEWIKKKKSYCCSGGDRVACGSSGASAPLPPHATCCAQLVGELFLCSRSQCLVKEKLFLLPTHCACASNMSIMLHTWTLCDIR